MLRKLRAFATVTAIMLVGNSHIYSLDEPKNFKVYTSEDTGVKIRYSNCLRPLDDNLNDLISFLPTDKCEGYSAGQGFGVTIWRTSGFKDLKGYERSIRRNYPNAKKIDYSFGRDKGVLLVTIKSEKDKLIDRNDQSNYAWTGAVWCGKQLVTVGWTDHLNKTEREKARKNTPSMPASFKELVDGLRCG